MNNENSENSKIFNDPVHGIIKLEELLVKIIDTPEFQRLRHIKQLGGVYYVYPGAQHNRFEHGIGTAHLASKLATHLKESQEKLFIDRTDPEGEDASKDESKDVLCVKIAGLCHDMGHGPFSHLFDRDFLRDEEWSHEEGSCDMFDRVMDRIDPRKKLLSDRDRTFVKELINPMTKPEGGSSDWPYKGRGKNKSFLYEIISNRENGIDVDKWDYIARDCHHLGIANVFDHNRLIELTRVLEVNSRKYGSMKSICFRDKEVFNLYDMFHMRFSLHKKAYKHSATCAIELMIYDALCEANKYIEIPSNDSNGKPCRIIDCIKKENLGSYCNLDDRILQQIELSKDPQLNPAKAIIERMSAGQRYRCIGKKVFLIEVPKRLLTDKKSFIKKKKDSLKNETEEFCEGKLPKKVKVVASILSFDYGRKEKDPIKSCWFYSKHKPNYPITVKREDVSTLLPSNFSEYEIQVFCKSEIDDNEKEILSTHYKEWFENGFIQVLSEA